MLVVQMMLTGVCYCTTLVRLDLQNHTDPGGFWKNMNLRPEAKQFVMKDS